MTPEKVASKPCGNAEYAQSLRNVYAPPDPAR